MSSHTPLSKPTVLCPQACCPQDHTRPGCSGLPRGCEGPQYSMTKKVDGVPAALRVVYLNPMQKFPYLAHLAHHPGGEEEEEGQDSFPQEAAAHVTMSQKCPHPHSPITPPHCDGRACEGGLWSQTTKPRSETCHLLKALSVSASLPVGIRIVFPCGAVLRIQ